MTTVHKPAAQLRPGDVVTAYPDPDHPDRFGQPGEWAIVEPDPRHERHIGDCVRLEYVADDGVCGMWALPADLLVQFRHPLTPGQRQEWLLSAGMVALVRVADHLMATDPDAFDLVVAHIAAHPAVTTRKEITR